MALGGNALLARGEKPDAGVELAHVRVAAEALAPLARDNEVVIVHGNGPQVGLLATESENDRGLSAPYPLDALGAMTQGMIGYWLCQALAGAGARKLPIAVVTQTEVSAADPGFANPTKFIGPVYDRGHAETLAAARGWVVAADGDSWRRVVPSPLPVGIVELEAVEGLLAAGHVVVCGGGGGAPVVRETGGALRGVEAVVDKDLTAAMIAIDLRADRLILLTDVAAVMKDFGTPNASEVRRLSLGELSGTHFPAGSMGPKIEACRRFVSATGNAAAIGAMADAAQILAGSSGTTVTAG